MIMEQALLDLVVAATKLCGTMSTFFAVGGGVLFVLSAFLGVKISKDFGK